MEEQTILDMCQAHNVKVSIEYDYDWAEWVIEVSSRNTRNPIKHTYNCLYTHLTLPTICSV